MPFNEVKNHSILFNDPTLEIGKIHWYFLRANTEMEERCWKSKKEEEEEEEEEEEGYLVSSSNNELTDFGEEVNFDEIHWWVFKKEKDIEELFDKTKETLEGVLKIKRDANLLKENYHSESYQKTIQRIKEFTENHSTNIHTLYEFIFWLYKRNILAPTILFSDRIWRSTRCAYEYQIYYDNVDEHITVLEEFTEIALGLRDNYDYTIYKAERSISEQLYDSDPEEYEIIKIDEKRIFSRATSMIMDRLTTYFQLIRYSLEEILEEIKRYYETKDILCSSKEKRLEKGAPFAFISHDSRDKEKVASHIAIGLMDMGCPVWYDEFSLDVGDNLRESIEKGIKECKKCILILSTNFLSNKGWTKLEFNSVFTREMIEMKDIILPVWVDIHKKEVYEYCPTLANKVATKWDLGKDAVINKLYHAINEE